eukprot:TRINITY_DN1938_c0_g2_i1.p1 TRINITY_DN1938_c0_g2~~TRINITY_DN1938_c0_g2_i1.p1  ORF type:complete len:1165 (+),score=384.97 TRINITY_DN1938_c0_g2_i1:206-3700(+)
MQKGKPSKGGKLDLSKKGLEEITTSYDFGNEERTRSIQTLLLSGNRLKQIQFADDFSTRFPQLVELNLSGNNLIDLPEAIGQLVGLEKLHVENNQLRFLPRTIGNLCNLKKFYVNHNELTELPEEIARLINLEVFHFSDNNIRILPWGICSSLMLKEISLFNNPIESPPPFAYNKGMGHLVRYMREIQASITHDTPSDAFIYQRQISFEPTDQKLKRNASAKNFKMIDGQSSKESSKEAAKAAKELQKKGVKVFQREIKEDLVSINQNYLLYFLVEQAACDEQGRRDYMEDRFVSFPRLHQLRSTKILDDVVNLFSKVSFFGIYDGHGGDKCADYLKDVLHQNICNTEAFAKGDFEKAMRDGFRKTDDAFLDICRSEGLLDGSTCLVVMMIDNKLITGHAGDSRAVLCRDKKAYRLTEDHKPDRADELARIEEAGGEVIYRGNCFRVSGDLAMSRSFGDLRLKEPFHLVISDPEMKVEELTPKDQFIILASDGFWDVLSDQKAVDIVRKADNVAEAAYKLVETAMIMGTMDNTTAVVVKLNWNLDFLTQEEIEGNVGRAKAERTPKKEKEKSSTSPEVRKVSSPSSPEPAALRSSSQNSNESEPEISEEQLERARSSSFSFRDGLEALRDDTASDSPRAARKSVYLPTTRNAITCKVLIPHISATKLIKFEASTKIKDVIRVLVLKHRFTGGVSAFTVVHKSTNGDVTLDAEKTLSECQILERDQIELRVNTEHAGEVTQKEMPTSEPDLAYTEALPPGLPISRKNSLRKINVNRDESGSAETQENSKDEISPVNSKEEITTENTKEEVAPSSPKKEISEENSVTQEKITSEVKSSENSDVESRPQTEDVQVQTEEKAAVTPEKVNEVDNSAENTVKDLQQQPTNQQVASEEGAAIPEAQTEPTPEKITAEPEQQAAETEPNTSNISTTESAEEPQIVEIQRRDSLPEPPTSPRVEPVPFKVAAPTRRTSFADTGSSPFAVAEARKRTNTTGDRAFSAPLTPRNLPPPSSPLPRPNIPEGKSEDVQGERKGESPTKNDKRLVEMTANVYKLEEGAWKPIGSGVARVIIVEGEDSQFRIVALGGNNQFVVNAWIRKERSSKKMSENFFSFGTVVQRVNATFGFKTKTKEEMDNFIAVFEKCSLRLQATPEETPKDNNRLKETFQI